MNKRLSIKTETISVRESNYIQFLQRNKIEEGKAKITRPI